MLSAKRQCRRQPRQRPPCLAARRSFSSSLRAGCDDLRLTVFSTCPSPLSCRSVLRKRNADNDRRTSARFDLELTADELYAFLHTHQSEPAIFLRTTHPILSVKADAIVLYDHLHVTSVTRENHAHNASLRMPRDVG